MYSVVSIIGDVEKKSMDFYSYDIMFEYIYGSV